MTESGQWQEIELFVLENDFIFHRPRRHGEEAHAASICQLSIDRGKGGGRTKGYMTVKATFHTDSP